MLKNVIEKYLLNFRKIKYSFFNSNTNVSGKCISYQPVVLRGKGTIHFGDNVSIGVINSQGFYNTYAYVEARKKEAFIRFGNHIHINNSLSIVAEKGITIEDCVLIGYNCQIIDSTFHNLESDRRLESDPNPKEVIIRRNVFIGNNVTILKGVTIGENTIVGNGAVVTKSFPENVIIGGIPAKIINYL